LGLTLRSPSPSKAWAPPTFCMAHIPAQLGFIDSCMYYNIHGLKLCFSRKEKHVKNAWVSGPDKMLKG